MTTIQPEKWKKYGGMNKLESYNNITVNTIVADTFTLKKAYYGTFDICGELHVSGNAIIDTNIKGNNLTIVNDISSNQLFVNNKSTHYADMDVYGNLTVYNGNAHFYKNLDISLNLYLSKQLFLGNSQLAFINATDGIGNIGINTTTPISAFDISSNQSFVMNVSSSLDNTYSVLTRNKNNRGILLQTDSSSSAINFFKQSTVNGYIQYYNPGVFTLSTSNNTNIWSTMSVTNRTTNGPLVNDHIFGETVVIYDVSNGTTPYLYPVYENDSETSGDALTLVSNNSVSNTFMNIVTPSKNGLSMGGGTYPKDTTRSMGTIGMLNTSGQYTPAINVVSGSSKIKHKSTVSIHNHCPETETYSLDVNGPIRVKNGELTITQQPVFEILQMKNGRTNPLFGVAIGSPYRKDVTSLQTFYRQEILYTNDGGENWNVSFDLSGKSIERTDFSNNNMTAVYVYDASVAFISGNNGFTAHTYNKGVNWYGIALADSANTSFIKSIYMSTSFRVFLGYASGLIYWFDVSSNIYTGGVTNSYAIRDGSLNVGTNNPVIGMDGSGNTLYVITTNTIYSYSINTGVTSPSLTSSRLCTIATPSYTSISVLDATHAIVVGTSAITYVNGGTWTDISAPYPLKSVYAYDTYNAMAVGANGAFIYSNNGYASWASVPTSLLNSGGNAARLLDSRYNLTNICMLSLNEFIISKTITSYVKDSIAGNTSVFNGYFPNLYNNATNYVMDISGSLRLSGDVNVNDGGKLNSNNSTFYLLNTGVKTISLGGDASCIVMGNASSMVTANYNWSVLHDASINGNVVTGGNLAVLHDSSLNGNVTVGGNVLCYTSIKATNYEGIDVCGNIFVGGFNTISGTRNIAIGNFSSNTINTKNIIKIGGNQDQIILGGTISSSISLKTGPIIYLNYLSLPNSSAGPGNQAAGIHIGDNGSLDAGYLVVSYDRAGYVMKSPASNTVVKLDISGLILPAATSKIVSLRLPSGANETIDSSYVVGVSSIDISNVFLKNYFISSSSQQVVDTSMSVLGQVSMGKSTSLISNTQLDISGNTISSRIGIGTTSVNASYTLDVSGDTHIKGNVSQDSGYYIWQF